MEMSTIVPIVLALLIFFGSVVSALNTVASKNEKIDLVFSLVQIVDRITETGVVTQKNFNDSIASLKGSLPVHFYVCITRVGDEDYSSCGLKSDDSTTPDQIFQKHSQDLISATFPITYQTTKDGVPFNEVNKVLVMVWKGA